jgi:hypothetical protein
MDGRDSLAVSKLNATTRQESWRAKMQQIRRKISNIAHGRRRSIPGGRGQIAPAILSFATFL